MTIGTGNSSHSLYKLLLRLTVAHFCCYFENCQLFLCDDWQYYSTMFYVVGSYLSLKAALIIIINYETKEVFQLSLVQDFTTINSSINNICDIYIYIYQRVIAIYTYISQNNKYSVNPFMTLFISHSSSIIVAVTSIFYYLLF